MPVIAKLNYLRIAPRKVRLVADLIRKKKVEEAQAILNFTTKKTAQPLLKLLKSALANARNNFQLNPANLYISEITVDEGPKYKRWMPRARGVVSEIQKKTSHITLALEEIVPAKKVKKVKKKIGQKEKKEAKRVTEEKFRPSKFPKENLAGKPKIQRGIRRIFQRKAF